MTQASRALEDRVVSGLPLDAAAGAILMPTLGWVKRAELSRVDKAAFAVDAVGYAVSIRAPARASRRRLVAAGGPDGDPPGFSVAKHLEGTGPWGEAAGRAGGTIAVLAALARLRRHHR